MLNIAYIQQNFVVRHDCLHKVLKGGALKPVKTVTQGYLVVTVDGTRQRACDVAWTLHHGHWPVVPVHPVSQDPLDMSVNNLMPVRTRRLRFTHSRDARGFFHYLEKGVRFPDLFSCREDWTRLACNHYKQDMDFVLRMGLSTSVPAAPAPVRAPRKPRPVAEPRPAMPRVVPGRHWFWYAGTWVSVPMAVHPADDAMARCQAVLDGAVKMVFDSSIQQVVPVWGPGGKGAGRADAEFVAMATWD